jgi:hypothetical protein
MDTSGLVDSHKVFNASRCCWLFVPSIFTQESLTAEKTLEEGSTNHFLSREIKRRRWHMRDWNIVSETDRLGRPA